MAFLVPNTKSASPSFESRELDAETVLPTSSGGSGDTFLSVMANVIPNGDDLISIVDDPSSIFDASRAPPPQDDGLEIATAIESPDSPILQQRIVKSEGEAITPAAVFEIDARDIRKPIENTPDLLNAKGVEFGRFDVAPDIRKETGLPNKVVDPETPLYIGASLAKETAGSVVVQTTFRSEKLGSPSTTNYTAVATPRPTDNLGDHSERRETAVDFARRHLPKPASNHPTDMPAMPRDFNHSLAFANKNEATHGQLLNPIAPAEVYSESVDIGFSDRILNSAIGGRVSVTPVMHQTLQQSSTISQIVVAFSDANVGDVLDIRLDPPELGKVRISLSLDSSETIKAVLSAEHFATLEYLKKHSDDLVRELGDAGFENIDLEYSRDNSNPFIDQSKENGIQKIDESSRERHKKDVVYLSLDKHTYLDVRI